MKLVPFKDTDIAHIRACFFGHFNTLFYAISGDHYLMREIMANLPISYFECRAGFGWKVGVAATSAPRGLWPQRPKPSQEVGPPGGPFGSIVTSKSCFEFLSYFLQYSIFSARLSAVY